MYTVIGLGNPGEEYTHTRHNVGFILLDLLQKQENFSAWDKNKYMQAFISSGELTEMPFRLVKPITYMNNSGETLGALVKDGMSLDKLIVLYDDIDIAFGELQIAFAKGDAGHNGIKSLIASVGSKDFIRIRVGVQPKKEDGTSIVIKGEAKADFVLKPFSKAEYETITTSLYSEVRNALYLIAKEGTTFAMNVINTKK